MTGLTSAVFQARRQTGQGNDVASIQNIFKTYMVTVFAMLLLVVALGILQVGFPFMAAQNTMMSFFARGAPPAILSLTTAAPCARLAPVPGSPLQLVYLLPGGASLARLQPVTAQRTPLPQCTRHQPPATCP